VQIFLPQQGLQSIIPKIFFSSAWSHSGKLRSKQHFASQTSVELPIQSEHTFTAGTLPPVHKDPFDRMLVAQATVEGIMLLTADATIAKYPGPIQKV
jgi:PIN domain nuclease of toxin-antitoxin system